jgi:hypothetical protein
LDLEATWTLTRDKGSSFLTLPLLQGDQLIGDDIFPKLTILVTSNSSVGSFSSHIVYIRSCGKLKYRSDLVRLADLSTSFSMCNPPMRVHLYQNGITTPQEQQEDGLPIRHDCYIPANS